MSDTQRHAETARRGCAMPRWLGTGLALALAAMSCTLPEFKKVDDGPSLRTTPDGGSGATPSCPMQSAFTGSCRSCLATHCCAEAQACDDGGCGEKIGLPITPVMQVTSGFDALAQCMLDHCDEEDTCAVSWGCVDNYKWPVLRDEHRFNMRVFGYADPRERGLPGVNVRLCESSDPRCLEDGGGFVMESVTDSTGNADFTAPRGFNGYFELAGGEPMPATVQWSQPVYNVVESFNHQALSADAVDGLSQVVGLHDKPGQPFKTDTGHLIVRMQNCLPMRYLEKKELDSRARDVQFTFSPQSGATRVYYVDKMAMLDPALDRTSGRGYAGAFEIQTTNVSVIAKHALTDKTLATGVLPLRVGTIGYMYLVPRPGD